MFDDQNQENVGSHKMTTDGVFILFKKTDKYNFSLFRGQGVSAMVVIKFLLPK